MVGIFNWLIIHGPIMGSYRWRLPPYTEGKMDSVGL